MGFEIERKFLINNEKFIELLEFMPHCSYGIWQYYMSDDIRLRIATHSDGHEVANFTIKTDNKTLMTRNEFESIVSIEDARTLAHVLTKSEVGLGPVRKSRHVFNHDGTVKWEVDIFHGSNEGLIIAEIEIPHKDYDLKLDPHGWIGVEVTEVERYYNSNLAKNPYKNWSKEK